MELLVEAIVNIIQKYHPKHILLVKRIIKTEIYVLMGERRHKIRMLWEGRNLSVCTNKEFMKALQSKLKKEFPTKHVAVYGEEALFGVLVSD